VVSAVQLEPLKSPLNLRWQVSTFGDFKPGTVSTSSATSTVWRAQILMLDREGDLSCVYGVGTFRSNARCPHLPGTCPSFRRFGRMAVREATLRHISQPVTFPNRHLEVEIE
jgi:hypothetical protein